MKTRILAFAIFIVFSIATVQSSSVPQDLTPAALGKVAPWVLEQTAAGKEAEFLVVLADQADLSPAELLATKEEKGIFVYNTLWKKAQSTQKSLLNWLKRRGIEYRSYYIVNMVWVKADSSVALALASRPDVARIDGNPVIANMLPRETEGVVRSSGRLAPLSPPNGIVYTNAPLVWSMGFTGQGIVVAGADTGIQWDHPALKSHYRGWNGAVANHNYNWHDSIHSSVGNPCGNDSPFPCGDQSHGTHTIGTAVGDDGAGNQIGMAPGAKWIGCRNMDNGNGTPATYIECFQFQLAPYPLGGTPAMGDPTQAPDLSTNSWGCPPSEGCSALTLQAAIDAQRAAGIVTVVAAGNSGSSCSTVRDPPSIYASSFTVGALNTGTDSIASFSSRGPVTIDGSNRMKPDIAAPGTSTFSSVLGGGYSSAFSGTSMATPHVAGAIALLLSAHPSLRGQVSTIENILKSSTVPITSGLCSSSGSPNNIYGFGRLDVKAAVDTFTTFAPTSLYFPASGDAGSISITGPAQIPWVAVANVPWIQITSSPNGAGNGTVTYLVSQNFTGVPRQGTITIASKNLVLTQASGVERECSFTFAAFATSFSAGGGTGTINVLSQSRCAWEATADQPWVTISSGCCGIGTGPVTYSVAPNPGPDSRKATIKIAEQTFTIKQKRP